MSLTESKEADRRRDFLVRLVGSLGARADDVEDLAHDAWIRFHEYGYAERATDPRAESALLARIGYSTYLDFLRKRKYRRTTEFLDEICGGDAAGDRVGSIARDLDVLVRIAGLEAFEVELLNRRFGRGETIPSLARALGLHTNTIRRRIERLIRRLRLAAAADQNAAMTVPENAS